MSQKPFIFISFISEDRSVADRVRASLDAFMKEQEVDWIVYQYTDPDQMLSGPGQANRLRHMIKNAVSNIVFVVSKASLRKQNSLVNLEVNAAIERKRESTNPDYLFAHAITVEDDLDIEKFAEHIELFDHPRLLKDIGSVWKSIQKTLGQFHIPTAPQKERLQTDSGVKLALTKSDQQHLAAFCELANTGFFDGSMPQFLLTLFGDREGHRIPHNLDEYLDSEDPNEFDYDMVSQYLSRRRLRDLATRAEGIYFGARSRKGLSEAFCHKPFANSKDAWVHVGIVNNSAATFSNTLRPVDEYLAVIESSGEVSNEWGHLVRLDGEKLFHEIDSGYNSTVLVIPCRAIADFRNRDIVGLFLPLDDSAKAMRSWTAAKRMEFHLLLQPVLSALLNSLMIQLVKSQLADPLARRPDIQRICLDAALTLSGSDWGCIKTRCIGTDGTIGSVAAECVLHCPRFYDEGVFPEADGAIGSVIASGESKVIRLGQNKKHGEKAHPAEAAYVCVLKPSEERYEFSNASSPRLQPSAIVLQHVNHSYLESYHDEYAAGVERVGKLYVAAVDTLMYREAFESISLLRYDVRQGRTISLSSIVREIVQDIFAKAPVAWALYSWDHEIDDKKSSLASSTKEAEASLRALIGMDLDISNFKNSLLYFACNSRHALAVHEVALNFDPFPVYRRREHNLAFRAYFTDGGVNKMARSDDSILLGKSSEIVKLFSRARFSALTVPLVSADGLPVGAFVIAKQTLWEDATIDRVCEHPNITRVARILYQLRHRSDIASIISHGIDVD